MKILFVVDDFDGGAGNVIQILANEFSNRENDITVLLLNYHTDYNYLNDKISIIKHNVNNKNLKSKTRWLIKTIKEIKEVITNVKPNVVISFLDNNNTLVGLSLMFNKIPLIVSERNNTIAIKPKGMWRFLRVPAYLRADAITVQCSNFLNFNRLFKKKMSVTPNPIISPQSIKMDSKQISNPVRIVSCARLIKRKRFDLMIRAFSLINKKNPNTTLYIYGEGYERDNLKKLISELSLNGKVFLPGRTNNVFDVLKKCDIYLMTSEQEGFPNSLSEAMAIGLPCVAFECHKGLQDLVNDSKNGFLIAPGNINLMAERVNALIESSDLREDISKQAKLVSEKFSVSSVSDLWEDIIYSVNKGFKK